MGVVLDALLRGLHRVLVRGADLSPLRWRAGLLQTLHALEEQVMDIEERIEAAIERITCGFAPMRVPADFTDPDLVLADCLTDIRRLRAFGAQGPEARAIVTALTPPEGYVLVPVEPTERCWTRARTPSRVPRCVYQRTGKERGQNPARGLKTTPRLAPSWLQ